MHLDLQKPETVKTTSGLVFKEQQQQQQHQQHQQHHHHHQEQYKKQSRYETSQVCKKIS